MNKLKTSQQLLLITSVKTESVEVVTLASSMPGHHWILNVLTAGRGLFCGVQNHSRIYCKTIKICTLLRLRTIQTLQS